MKVPADVGVQVNVQLPAVNVQLVGNPVAAPENDTVPTAASR